jgi:tetratricopeptide (TPR) repeat protein
MTEELITNLAPIPELKVISRTSVMRYKNSTESLGAIARALGVDVVVEGSVQRVGNRVRITAQVIEAATDRHLWAKSFDRDFSEILALQTEVARGIANEIQMELTPDVSARLSTARPVDPRAYELDLKGRYEWSKMTEPDVLKAIDYFGQALALDPNDARASSGMADAYLVRTQVFGAIPLREGMAKVKEFAGRALAADPGSAEAHASNAAALLFGEWDFVRAESEIHKSVEINPGYAPGRLIYSILLSAQNRIPEAIEQDRRALELDPMSIIVHWNAVNTLRVAHRYGEAVELAERGLRIDPRASLLHGSVLGILQQKEDFAAALDLIDRHLPQEEGGKVHAARMRRGYEADGAVGYWRAAIARVEAMKEESPEQEMRLAFLYAQLGNRTKALDHLERAYEGRASDVLFIRAEPAFSSLREEPRFKEIVRRVGFPDMTTRRARPGAG